jgi:hypothetical protein
LEFRRKKTKTKINQTDAFQTFPHVLQTNLQLQHLPSDSNCLSVALSPQKFLPEKRNQNKNNTKRRTHNKNRIQNQLKSNQIRSDQIKSTNQTKSNQIESNHINRTFSFSSEKKKKKKKGKTCPFASAKMTLPSTVSTEEMLLHDFANSSLHKSTRPFFCF